MKGLIILLDTETKEKCKYIIHGASTAAGAIGLSPIPGSDTMPIIGIQVSMIIALGNVLDISIDKSFATSLAKTALAKQAGKMIAGQLTKAIPVIGSGINAAVAFGITETLGWDFVRDYTA